MKHSWSLELIKIFVGCAANTEDAESQSVLEWSIRKHTKAEVEIHWMKLSKDVTSPFYSDAGQGWNTSKWATPFSAFRWAIPWLCNFEGRAIYTDSDVIFMADVEELWSQPIPPGKIVLAKGGEASWRYCVSLWDCAACAPHWPKFPQARSDSELHSKMTRFMRANFNLVHKFQGNWNCLDGEKYEDLSNPDIKAIHYTSMRHQPQHPIAAKRLAAKGMRHWFDDEPAEHWRPDLIDLFNELYDEACENGYGPERYEQEPLFGPYVKKNVGNQGRTIPSWGNK